MRMKLPGTSPPKVQNRYSTPSDNFRTTSFTSSVTMTLVACDRRIGGGTLGAWVRTAASSPTIAEPFSLGPGAADRRTVPRVVARPRTAREQEQNRIKFIPKSSAKRSERTNPPLLRVVHFLFKPS